MIPELETLYKQAASAENLTRWLQDRDIIKSYEDSFRYAEEGQALLLGRLAGEELEMFRRYLDNRAEREDAESRMLFSQGLSIGLRLGSLCAWV